jgi:hypothetical protein
VPSERALAFVPPGVRRAAARTILGARQLTHAWRPLPDTLIIGTMRGGTTSLFRWLAAHPRVEASLRKEVGYFTTEYGRGPGWYRAHFPLSLRGEQAGTRRLEASPDYMLDPRAAARAAALVPAARIVALLRDPVDRAWSHHRVLNRVGIETLGFDEALDAEAGRSAAGWRELEADPEAPLPVSLIHGTYVARGRYAEQLARWLACYPRERVLVLRSEDLYERTEGTFAEVLRFLELEPWRPREFTAYSWDRSTSEGAARAPADVRRRLAPIFTEANRALADLLGWEAPWPAEPAP